MHIAKLNAIEPIASENKNALHNLYDECEELLWLKLNLNKLFF
jgi:hypothetical protein